MSYSYDRYETQRRRQTTNASPRRSTLGYWVPLALTVTAATVGLAAWIWSERRDDDDDDEGYDNGGGPPPARDYGDSQPDQAIYARRGETTHVEDESMMGRMSGALRRTPSPQQLFDGARERVVAGMTAAGAAVGGALSSIREEDKGDFEDHSRWSEEAETRAGVASKGVGSTQTTVGGAASNRGGTRQARPAGGRQKAVAIVVSADVEHHGQAEEDESYLQEHASILSHLPQHIDSDTRIFVLIYAPTLKQHPLSSTRPIPSLTSSYSNIGPEDFPSETDKPLSLISPNTHSPPSSNPQFSALYTQALALVENPTLILPFTDSSGHVHLLRHLAPEIVYVQESLSGSGGEMVKHISGWVGQVVLVVGDEGGHGGLVDSEDEAGEEEKRERWWEGDERIGLGKGIEVVEGLRVGEDWKRRVGGRD
ncbi:MAG: hypothetical protein FRX48_09629 [Lasallia pustulata]|uniref:Peroxin 22-like n=1 Tax=Lasallia pustulata TaxID=136370 RepID=A0A5M8PCA6_9LECA|nr:MAG: hypothetical protein FRX48_09629 [Lasallia pustulata]